MRRMIAIAALVFVASAWAGEAPDGVYWMETGSEKVKVSVKRDRVVKTEGGSGRAIAPPGGTYWMETPTEKVKIKLRLGRIVGTWRFTKAKPAPKPKKKKENPGFFASIAAAWNNIGKEAAATDKARTKGVPMATPKIIAEIRKIRAVIDVAVRDNGGVWVFTVVRRGTAAPKARAIAEASMRAAIRAMESKAYIGGPPKTRFSYFVDVSEPGGFTLAECHKVPAAEWISWD